MIWLVVCPSVTIETAGRIELVFGTETEAYPTLCLKKYATSLFFE